MSPTVLRRAYVVPSRLAGKHLPAAICCLLNQLLRGIGSRSVSVPAAIDVTPNASVRSETARRHSALGLHGLQSLKEELCRHVPGLGAGVRFDRSSVEGRVPCASHRSG